MVNSLEERPSWGQYFLRLAELAAERSTCSRAQVGTVIVENNHVISTGFNGAPSGVQHCDHSQSSDPCTISVHSEANALLWAGRNTLGFRTMYTTRAPCDACAGLIINGGIVAVYYKDDHRHSLGLDLLREGEVYFEKIK